MTAQPPNNLNKNSLRYLPNMPNHVILWIFPSCNCKSVPIMSLLDILQCFLTNMPHMSLLDILLCFLTNMPHMSLLDILLCFLTNMLNMSLQVSFTMSLQARFPYVIASVLLICHCEYPLPCHYKFVPPHVIARSGSKRRGNLLPVLHLDVADHASRKQVGHCFVCNLL